jgi:(2Fe-2S) ferredoxin
MKPSLLSTREKLLLGLLCSSMVFSLSFSFSYGAVNQTKVDSIMKMITDGGNKFSDTISAGSNKSERTLYYEKVDAGLGDAVEMLGTVRNKIRTEVL